MASASLPPPDPAAGEMPYPGDELVYRVFGSPNREGFFATGEQSVNDISSALAVIGRGIGDYRTILDFGCGCGRIMLWLSGLKDTCAFHGCDTDERAIAWDRKAMPWATFVANQPLPPLPYPDDHFDLIFNHSVFTHLDADYQDAWLAELRRVTKPGGTVLLSVHGEHAFETIYGAAPTVGSDAAILFDRLNRTGIAFLTGDAWMGSALPDYYHTTFHAPWYVFEHWGRFFTVRSYQVGRSVGIQDFVLLEKPAEARESRFHITRRPPEVTAPAAVVTVLAAPASTASGDDDLVAAEGLLRAGPRIDSVTGLGAAGRLARQGLYRVIRHYEEHQRRVLGHVTAAVRRLEAKVADLEAGATAATDPAPSLLPDGLTVAESHYRMRDAMARVGDRITRLEVDVFQAIDARPTPAPTAVLPTEADGLDAGDPPVGDA